VKGEVKKIDQAAGKITLTSGPIKSLDMVQDNMTMVFRVQDPAVLRQLKVGDKVQFEAGRVNGQIMVTTIQKSNRVRSSGEETNVKTAFPIEVSVVAVVAKAAAHHRHN
jgi:Cu(I)/Ag(I) efflux system protein CusF